MRKYLLPIAACAAMLGSAAAFAAQTSDTFQTRIAIQTSCAITVGDVDFGNVGVINGTETASGAVSRYSKVSRLYASPSTKQR